MRHEIRTSLGSTELKIKQVSKSPPTINVKFINVASTGPASAKMEAQWISMGSNAGYSSFQRTARTSETVTNGAWGCVSVNNAADGIEYEDCKADMDFESNTIELDQ
jgi:hypothetical protein